MKNAPCILALRAARIFSFGLSRQRVLGLGLAAPFALVCTYSSAETISHALVLAYRANPQLNAQRAATRAVDENLPGALAGYRPTVSATGSTGFQQTNIASPLGQLNTHTRPRSVGVSVTQNLYNGNRTANSVSQAEARILQSREELRQLESNTLKDAVSVYMGVLRSIAVLNLRRNNVSFLEQQLAQTRERFKYGEVTQTDVFQAEGSLAQSRSDLASAIADFQTNAGSYHQVIGIPPARLEPARPVEILLPKSLEQAMALAERESAPIQAALHAVDVAEMAARMAAGQLLPTLSVTGSVAKQYDYSSTPKETLFNSSLTAQLNVPLYEGGSVYAQVRQAKELLGQARLQVDIQRAQVRAAVVQAWAGWSAAKSMIGNAQTQVIAAEKALKSVREEAKQGERTTYDVLISQQNLVNARIQLLTAQSTRIVGSYNVLAAIGGLSSSALKLDVDRYDPTVHFDQVKNKWVGLDPPDGR